MQCILNSNYILLPPCNQEVMRRYRASVFESIPLAIWKTKLPHSILSYHKTTAESVQYTLGFLVVILVEKLVCTDFQIPLSSAVFILFMSGTKGRKRQKVELAYKVYRRFHSFYPAKPLMDGNVQSLSYLTPL